MERVENEKRSCIYFLVSSSGTCSTSASSAFLLSPVSAAVVEDMIIGCLVKVCCYRLVGE